MSGGSSTQMSKSHSLSNSVGSSTKAPLLHPLEYEQWVDRMEDFLYTTDKDLWRSVSDGPVVIGTAAMMGGAEADVALNTNAENRQADNDRRAKMMLRHGLPTYIYTRVQDCKSAKAMWEKLKDLYQGTDKRKKGQMKNAVYEFGGFCQKEGESLFDCYTRFCILVDSLRKHGIERTQLELNILFLKALRKEWKQICSLIRNNEQVDDYSLVELYDMLKNHEEDLDMNDDKTVGGQLAFSCQEDGRTTTCKKEFSGEEIVLSEHDSGNDKCFIVNGKRMFYKKPAKVYSKEEWRVYNERKQNERKSGDTHSDKSFVKPDERSYVKSDDKSKSVTCFECGEKNHYAKDCLVKKEKEKAEQSKFVDEVAYYTSKLKIAQEARDMERKDTKGIALVAYGESDGEEQVWSTGSDDEEMKKPTHGKSMEQLRKEEAEFAEDERIWKAHCAQVQADSRARKGTGKGNNAFYAKHEEECVRKCEDDSVGSGLIWESDDEEIWVAEGAGGIALMAAHEPVAQATPRTIPEQVTFLLRSFNIPESSFMSDIVVITNTCTAMNRMLSEANERANNTRDSLCLTTAKYEELRTKYAKLEMRVEELGDDVIKMRRENVILLKQRNIFCNTARRLHAYITRIYHSCSVSDDQHKRLLPFTTMKVNDVNKLNFDCESIVSMEEIPNNTYALGVIDCEILDTDELTNIVNVALSKNEQNEILQNSEKQTDSSKVDLDKVELVKNLDEIHVKLLTNWQPVRGAITIMGQIHN